MASVSRVPLTSRRDRRRFSSLSGKEVARACVLRGVIARWWRGWAATAEDADAYEELLRSTIFPWVRTFEGQEGTYLFRRELRRARSSSPRSRSGSPGTPSGPSPATIAETAVVPDEARAVLSRWDERSAHYELIEGPAG